MQWDFVSPEWNTIEKNHFWSNLMPSAILKYFKKITGVFQDNMYVFLKQNFLQEHLDHIPSANLSGCYLLFLQNIL